MRPYDRPDWCRGHDRIAARRQCSPGTWRSATRSPRVSATHIPASPNGLRGWADHVAVALAQNNPELRYANLAVRGRRMDEILAEQVQTAVMLEPDLVTVYAGMNDLLLVRNDIDAMMARYADALKTLQQTGAHVLTFTAADLGTVPLFRRLRGRAAVYNELLRTVADDLGVQLVDFWRFSEFRDPRLWAGDRIHLSPLGHERMAAKVLDTLTVPHKLTSRSAALLASSPPGRSFWGNLDGRPRSRRRGSRKQTQTRDARRGCRAEVDDAGSRWFAMTRQRYSVAGGRFRPAPRRRPPKRSTTPSARPSGWTPRRRSSPEPAATVPCPRSRPPRPSAPTPSSSSTVVSPSASRPTTCRPASAQFFSVRLRFVALRHRHPGGRTRAGAPRHRGNGRRPPLRDHHAVATERRHGSDDRTEVAWIGDVVQRHHQRGRRCLSSHRPAGRRDARTSTAAPAARCPDAARWRAMRSRSCRGTSRIEMPESAASLTDSVSRSSASAPSATYSAVAGTPARRHSSTGLRPSTISVSSVFAGRPPLLLLRPWPRVWRRGGWAACVRAAWRRGPRARAGAHRRTRPSAPSWCRVCVPRPGAASSQPSISCTRRAAPTAVRRRYR